MFAVLGDIEFELITWLRNNVRSTADVCRTG